MSPSRHRTTRPDSEDEREDGGVDGPATAHDPRDERSSSTRTAAPSEDALSTGTLEDVPVEADAEKPSRVLTGRLATALSGVAVLLSLYAVWNVFSPVPALQYRIVFLAVVLPMTFLLYRPALRVLRGGPTEAPSLLDWGLAGASVFVTSWPLLAGFDTYISRGFAPFVIDVVCGMLLVALVLIATWRTVGPVLPFVCALFIVYAMFGDLIPNGWLIGHRGYDLPRLTSAFVMGTEGIFGVPLDVAATYIILFTIYGAVLEYSGAGQFFLDISFAAFRRSRSAPGRTVTLAGFLLGTVSGSGTATAVSLGSVSWPILQKAGYPRESAGGVLAAAGIGAILSPPTLGAAAFIIAELLRVSYLQVLGYALIPTLLYYLGILLAVEFDARRFGVREVAVVRKSFWRLLLRFGYHFSSLFVIVGLLAVGQSAFKAVVYASVVAFALSFLDRSRRMTPPRLLAALAKGATGVLPVAATCAAAGLIVAVLTLTGLGLDLSSIIVDLADLVADSPTAILLVTCVLAAVAVLVLGLAVPVTASFIIAAVIIAPALTELGVARPEAYMFIFYYAVLSEVSPPTALAAVAAAAITGGNAYKTMIATFKYTLPAFLVPLAFVITPNGSGLIGQGPLLQVVWVTVVSALAVAGLAVVTGRWLLGPARLPERVLAGVGALFLLYLETTTVLIGLGTLALAVVVHLLGRRVRPVDPSHDTRTVQEATP